MIIMKIIVAPDSFKECMPSREVAAVMADAVRKRWPGADVVALPLSDGGEGALDRLLRPGRAAARSGKYAGSTRRHTGAEELSTDTSLILTDEELELSVGELLDLLTGRMSEAAGELRFEEAAKYRDIIRKLRSADS